MEPVLLPLDLGERLVPYNEAWDRQQKLHEQVVAGEAPPTIMLLEHAHVYTAGTRTEPADLPPPDEPLVEVNRGGRITWHGPGQVVAYPIVPLRSPVDVVGFVRALEAAVIDTCAELGLTTTRCDGRSGVWVTPATVDRTCAGGAAGAPAASPPAASMQSSHVGERKISAVGVRVARGVSMHGVALNVDCDLGAFGRIVPCGISDAGVTSLAAEGVPLPASGAVPYVGEVLGRRLSEALRWD